MTSLRSSGPTPFNEDPQDQYEELHHYVKREGRRYLSSHPGDDHRAANSTLHTNLRSIIGGWRPWKSLLAQIRREIDYRMIHVMDVATQYKNILGVDYPDCHRISTDAIPRSRVWRQVVDYPLFDEGYIQGKEYTKGVQYIAACMESAGWDEGECKTRLESLVRYKGKHSCALSIRFRPFSRD